MKYVIAALLIGGGILTLIRVREAAASGARFHQRIAEKHPGYAWGNPNVSDEFWRYFAPVSAVLSIAVGVAILIFVPS
jgi:hypothetical protein